MFARWAAPVVRFICASIVLAFVLTAAFVAAAGTIRQRTQTVIVTPSTRHHYMSRHTNSMHDDASASDSTPAPGPVGRRADWKYHEVGGLSNIGMCPTFVFDSRGRVITLKAKRKEMALLHIDPQKMNVLASKDLPRYSLRKRIKRFFRFFADPGEAFESTPAGPYLFIDHRDRVVVPTVKDEIRIYSLNDAGDRFAAVQVIKLRRDKSIRPQGMDDDDELEAILPHWKSPDLYWFATSDGAVGLADARTGAVQSVRLPKGEMIRNSFPVGPDGAFILSNRALYRFDTEGSSHRLVSRWRQEYPAVTKEKPGQLGPGSGTTPTLFGNFVTFGDCGDDPAVHARADTRMRVRIHRRDNGRLTEAYPVFAAGASHGENSFIAHRSSLVVCNTYGYRSPFDDHRMVQAPADASRPPIVGAKRILPGGLARIDVDPVTGRRKGGWENDFRIRTTTPKLSTANGIIYAYTYLRPEDLWAVVGIRLQDGKEAFRIPISRPKMSGMLQSGHDKFDNAWGPVFIAPAREGHPPTMFIGMIHGFLRVMDGG